MSTIDTRLQYLEDMMSIQQLFIDYGYYLDAGDFKQYAQLFAQGGEVQLGPLGCAKGPVEIEALMTKALSDQVGKSYHLISSPVIKLNGDEASSDVMWTVILRSESDQPVVSMMGRHRDKLVRENGLWRFKLRRGYVDIPAVVSD